jgi:hypothetical protein
MPDISKSRDENPSPTIGAPDPRTPEQTRAESYEWHKNNGTLGTFYELYGGKRERHHSLREALNQHIEAAEHGRGREHIPEIKRSGGVER